LRQGQVFFMQLTGDPHISQLMTLARLADARDRQALSLAYFDIFWCSGGRGRVAGFSWCC